MIIEELYSACQVVASILTDIRCNFYIYFGMCDICKSKTFLVQDRLMSDLTRYAYLSCAMCKNTYVTA